MHILAGSCCFTPTGGEPVEIHAGDTLFFPAHTTGVWETCETLRKVFVVLAKEWSAREGHAEALAPPCALTARA